MEDFVDRKEIERLWRQKGWSPFSLQDNAMSSQRHVGIIRELIWSNYNKLNASTAQAYNLREARGFPSINMGFHFTTLPSVVVLQNLCLLHSILIFISCRFWSFLITSLNTFEYHIFAPMGRFQLELILIYLYFPPSSHLIVVVSVL